MEGADQTRPRRALRMPARCAPRLDTRRPSRPLPTPPLLRRLRAAETANRRLILLFPSVHRRRPLRAEVGGRPPCAGCAFALYLCCAATDSCSSGSYSTVSPASRSSSTGRRRAASSPGASPSAVTAAPMSFASAAAFGTSCCRRASTRSRRGCPAAARAFRGVRPSQCLSTRSERGRRRAAHTWTAAPLPRRPWSPSECCRLRSLARWRGCCRLRSSAMWRASGSCSRGRPQRRLPSQAGQRRTPGRCFRRWELQGATGRLLRFSR